MLEVAPHDILHNPGDIKVNPEEDVKSNPEEQRDSIPEYDPEDLLPIGKNEEASMVDPNALQASLYNSVSLPVEGLIEIAETNLSEVTIDKKVCEKDDESQSDYENENGSEAD
jgi:hypothetical protein